LVEDCSVESPHLCHRMQVASQLPQSEQLWAPVLGGSPPASWSEGMRRGLEGRGMHSKGGGFSREGNSQRNTGLTNDSERYTCGISYRIELISSGCGLFFSLPGSHTAVIN
jgi:hypothetical protein